MKNLVLRSNSLTQFNPQASGLQSLRVLDVSNNMLTEFNSAELGLHSLEELKVRSNDLSSPPNITTNQLGLLTLDMAYNNFNEIPDAYLKPFLNSSGYIWFTVNNDSRLITLNKVSSLMFPQKRWIFWHNIFILCLNCQKINVVLTNLGQIKWLPLTSHVI